MTNFFQIRMGRANAYAVEGRQGNYIGVSFDCQIDLSDKLQEGQASFSAWFIPYYQEARPESSRLSAGSAAGSLWRVAGEIVQGDYVVVPKGDGQYFVGSIAGPYEYHPHTVLPHRRPVEWLDRQVESAHMSAQLKRTLRYIGTLSNITHHADELEALIAGRITQTAQLDGEALVDPSVFALEMHLEDFLVANWANTELGSKYKIYEEEGELVGQQYQTDTGPMDILAISHDSTELLVVELKKGRTSDAAVGQVQRYMGYVKEVLASEGQRVRGVVIAQQDDLRIRRALSVAQDIDFFTYEVEFRLNGVEC